MISLNDVILIFIKTLKIEKKEIVDKFHPNLYLDWLYTFNQRKLDENIKKVSIRVKHVIH